MQITSTEGLGITLTIDHTFFPWSKTDDFKKWASDKPKEFNMFSYLRMVEERDKATRLEF